MANTILTAKQIATTALIGLRSKLNMGNLVYRKYKNDFGKKEGNTITIKKPMYFRSQSGSQRVPQNLQERSIDFTLNGREHVSWTWSVEDLSLSIKDYYKQYILPAVRALAVKIESDLLDLHDDIPSYTGTAGTTLSAFTNFSDSAQKLDEACCPDDDRHTVLAPKEFWKAADIFGGKYSPQMVEKALRKGSLGVIADNDIFKSQLVKTHTIGTWATDILVNGANQEGSSLICDAATSTAAKAGDKFTIDDVYAVNPETGDSTGSLRIFTLTADATASGADITFSISPSIITSGAFQTVDAAPANNAAITEPTGNYKANMMFHRNAFGLVTVPLAVPESCPFKAIVSMDGLSITLTKAFDIDAYEEVVRLDIMYGVKTLYPELANVIYG